MTVLSLKSLLGLALVAAVPLRTREGDNPNLPFDKNTSSYCSWWVDHDGSQTCEEVVEWNWIDLRAFYRWNPSVKSDCSGLQSGRSYCVEAYGEPDPPEEPEITTTGVVVTTTKAATTTTEAPTTTVTPTTTTTPADNSVETPSPVHLGLVANCNKFYLVKGGDSCAVIAQMHGLRNADVVSWNGLNSGCTNLWSETYACVGIIGGSTVTQIPTTTTTPAGNGIETPSPVHIGIVANCNKFYLVKGGDNCAVIAQMHGLRNADVVSWNGLNSGCTNLWGETYACIGVVGGSTTPPTTTVPSNGVNTPLPIQPGMVANCNKFHDIKSSTTCQGIADYNKITLSDFYKWNPVVNKGCTNLILGAYACTGVVGRTTPPTTTNPGNGVTTPQPIQPGMVSNCNKFHDIKVGTTCQAIADYNKFPIADFYKWNPQVNSGCTNLILGAYACTGVIGGGSSTPPTTTNPGNGVTTPQPIQPGMVSNCNKFHDIKVGTTCQAIADYNKFPIADFYKWNPQVNSGCTNLILGAYACTGVIGGGSSTPTNPGNGVTTPRPIQPGMVSNCNKFHDIKVGTTCQGIADYNKFPLADFFKWNPGVNAACTNLQLGAYACTGIIGGGGSSPSPVTTPTPTQAGMVQGCTAFATVRPTTTCQGILDWNKITLANFVKWNPAVRSDCSNLWSGTWACIAGP